MYSLVRLYVICNQCVRLAQAIIWGQLLDANVHFMDNASLLSKQYYKYEMHECEVHSCH